MVYACHNSYMSSARVLGTQSETYEIKLPFSFWWRSALEKSSGTSINFVNSEWWYYDPWSRNSHIGQKYILLHWTDILIRSANCQVWFILHFLSDAITSHWYYYKNQNAELHWGFWSSGMWRCIFGYMVPNILKECISLISSWQYISLKCREALNQQCSITFQKTGILN